MQTRAFRYVRKSGKIVFMTSISTSDIGHLATLSGISLAADELESLGGDIEKIIDYIKMLDELDVEGVEPTYQVTGLSNINRPDEVELGGVEPKQLLELAPDVQDDQVKVPQVL